MLILEHQLNFQNEKIKTLQRDLMLDEIINQMLPGAEVSLRRKFNLPANVNSRNPEQSTTPQAD
jgi:hypothetical protein